MNYFYNGKMPEQMNFKILYLNRFSQEMLYTHILHTHPFVELFYVLSGEGFFLKDEAEEPVLILTVYCRISLVI